MIFSGKSAENSFLICVKSLYLHPKSSLPAWTENALVVELVDALDSKSSDRKIVWVRFPPKVQQIEKTVNRKRAPEKRARFLFGAMRIDCFFDFQAQLEGNTGKARESHFRFDFQALKGSKYQFSS